MLFMFEYFEFDIHHELGNRKYVDLIPRPTSSTVAMTTNAEPSRELVAGTHGIFYKVLPVNLGTSFGAFHLMIRLNLKRLEYEGNVEDLWNASSLWNDHVLHTPLIFLSIITIFNSLMN